MSPNLDRVRLILHIYHLQMQRQNHMEAFKNTQMQNKPLSICEYKHWHFVRMKDGVTGRGMKDMFIPHHVHINETHTHSHTNNLLLVLQYLRRLPFLIYQQSRWPDLSGLGLVQGMVTQRAVREHCHNVLSFGVFTDSLHHAFVKKWEEKKQCFGAKLILETAC